MIRLSSFEPELFNRNADQGNMLVLKRQLEWRGVEFELLSEFDAAADFVLIGDAFSAVTEHLRAELLALAPSLQRRLDLGLPTLIVGSSYEFFMGVLNGLPQPKRATRESEFRRVTSKDISAFGYRNTDLASDDLYVKGGFIATTLYGPVLAKSPDLLALVLSDLGVSQKLEASLDAVLSEYLTQLIRTSTAG